MKYHSGKSVFIWSAALIALLISGCSSSSTPSACADVEQAMTPFWDINAELAAIPMDEEIPQAVRDAYVESQAQAAIEMARIGESETGDISKMADLFSVFLTEGATTPEGEDAGMAAYMMLDSICELSVQQ